MSAVAPPVLVTTVDPELGAILTDHGARWGITRRTDHGSNPGAFHAVRHDPRPSLQRLSAGTAEDLRSAIECVEETAR